VSGAAGTRAWRRRPEHLAEGGRPVAAETVYDDNVAGVEHWNELLFEAGRNAGRREKSAPASGHGAHLVLIQVSSMKTRRRGYAIK
jgi:hypothetical protein